MNIGIDISQIVYRGTGVSRYLEGLMGAITQYNTNHHWSFFFSSLRQNIPDFLDRNLGKKKYSIVRSYIPPRLLSFIWNDLHVVPIETFTGKLDWFITSDWTEPPSHMKKATVIHDLAYLRYPETVEQTILRTQKSRMRWVKKESDIIFTVSRTTKQDVIDLLHISPHKIYSLYSGISIDVPTSQDVQTTLKKYSLHRPFILTVGKIEPRKNLKSLIQAYKKLPHQKGSKIDLVIVGPSGWDSLEEQQNSNIHVLGYVTNKELYSFYCSCLFFVYPSLWEGYGYPLVEAMKLGAPIACSNTSSLAEIGKGASLFFDPLNIESITNALRRMIDDETFRKELIIKGQEKSRLFSWKTYYYEMIHILETYVDSR